MSCHPYVFLKRIMEEFCLLMRGRSNVLVCHGQIKSAFMKGGNDLDTGKLLSCLLYTSDAVDEL